MSLEAQLERLNTNLESLIETFGNSQLATYAAYAEVAKGGAADVDPSEFGVPDVVVDSGDTPKAEEKPKRKPRAPKKEKGEETPKTEEPETQPETETKVETELTEADVRKVLGDAARKKGSPFPKKLLGEFDCERLSDLDPSRYAEIIARAKKEAGV